MANEFLAQPMPTKLTGRWHGRSASPDGGNYDYWYEFDDDGRYRYHEEGGSYQSNPGFDMSSSLSSSRKLSGRYEITEDGSLTLGPDGGGYKTLELEFEEEGVRIGGVLYTKLR